MKDGLIIIVGIAICISALLFAGRPDESDSVFSVMGAAIASGDGEPAYDNRAIQYLPAENDVNLAPIQLVSQPRRYGNGLVCYDGQYNRISCLDES